MERTPQARTAAKAHKSAAPAQAPLKAVKRRSEKRTSIRNVTRSWTPNAHTRYTDYLAADKAMDIIAAANHALVIGLPLNLSITIHFERGNLKPLYRPQHAIGAFIKLATQWLGLRGITGTYIWVMEHVMGTGRHVHILMHCPPEHQKDFKEMAKKKWPKKSGMDTTDKHTVHIERVGPRGYTFAQSSEKHHAQYKRQLDGSLKYHLKGMDPDQTLPKITGSERPVAELLGVYPEGNQRIFGRRSSSSQNISEGARDRYAAGSEQSNGPTATQ